MADERVRLGENFGVEVIRGSESQNVFDCQRCGWCCRNVNINISYSDILRWSKEGRFDILNEISYIDDEDEDRKGFYILETVKAPKRACPFLTMENGTPICSIHDTRPRACKEFPSAHSNDEKREIKCPARGSFQLGEAKLMRLKMDQSIDFRLAEDRKDKLLKVLQIARNILSGMKDIKEFGDDPTENLPVDGLGTERTGWTEVGTSPYLDFQDQPTNYIWSTTKKAEHGDFTFQDHGIGSGTINSVTLYMYGQDAGDGGTDVWVWDGSAWTEYANPVIPVSWDWFTIDVSATLDTWTKIDAAKMYIEKGNNTERVDIDAAYLLVDYVGGTTTDAYISETVTLSDSWKEDVLYLYERYLSESVALSDIWKQQLIEYVASSFLTETITVADTWKEETLKVFSSYLSEGVTATDSWEEESLYVYDSFLDETATISDNWTFEEVSTFASFLTETVTVSDTWKQEFVAGGAQTYNTYISETITVTDSFVQVSPMKRYWDAPANGTWETASNWFPYGTPQEGDDIYFDSRSTFDCGMSTSNLPIDGLTFDTGYTGTMTLSSGAVLSVTYTADGSDFIGTEGTFDASDGTIKVSGDWDTSSVNFTFTRGTSTIQFTGNGTVKQREGPSSGYALNHVIIDVGTTRTAVGNLRIMGLFTINGTAIGGIYWHSYTNANPIVFGGSGDISGAGYTAGHQIDFNLPGKTYNSLSISGGGGYRATVAGTLTVNNDISISYNGYFNTGTCEMDTNGQTISVGGDLKIGISGRDAVLICGSSSIGVSGHVSIGDVASYILFNTSQWTVSGNWDNNSTSANWDEGTATVEFDGSTAQNIDNSDLDLYNVHLSGTGQKNFTGGVRVVNEIRALNDITMKVTNTTPTITMADGADIYADATYTLTLNSDDGINDWNLKAEGTTVATRVDVAHSDASTGNWINAMRPGVIDSGDNTNWEFGRRYISETVNAADEWFQQYVPSGATFASFLSESVTATDAWLYALKKLYGTYLSETVSTTDNWYQQHLEYVVSSFISETVTATDNWKEEVLRVFVREIAESVSASDSWTQATVKIFNEFLSETVTVSDEWYQEFIEYLANRFISEDVSVSEAWKQELLKAFTSFLSESVSATDAWLAVKVENIYPTFVSETVTATDAWREETLRVLDRFLTESVSVSDAWVFEKIEYLATSFITEAVTATDAWKQEALHVFASYLTESVTGTDAWKQELLQTISRTLSESVSVSDSWKQEEIEVSTFDRFLSETVTVTDVFLQSATVAAHTSKIARIIAVIGGD